MKNLNGLNEPILGLDLKPLLEIDGSKVTIKSILSNTLARGQSDEPARAMNLALKIYNAQDKLEIEDPDFILLKEAVEKDQVLNNMAKSACLKVLEEK